jgi:hypothetical protein
MNRWYSLLLLIPLVVGVAAGQIYKGPASGSVPTGAAVSTGSFLPGAPSTFPGPIVQYPRNKIPIMLLPDPAGLQKPAAPMGSNYVEDPSARLATQNLPPIPLVSMPGIPDQATTIPPDPYLAVGPNHVIAVVNSRFRIWDKAGNVLKTIEGEPWFANVYPRNNCFDPKVFYDQHAGRWVMVWLQQSDAESTGTFLISVSDDSDPLGNWYNWAIPSTVNGSTVDSTVGKSWADYQGVGYDDQALYITSNQWGFGSSFRYEKVRIIPKSELYAATPGPLSWTDLWGLKDQNGAYDFGTRPARVYGHPGEYYLVGDSRYSTSTYFRVYRITDPLTSPTITAVNVPVAASATPPQANQLGGSTTLIESGGRALRNEPVYMDSSLWVVHCVASGPGNAYASVRYARINTVTNTVTEDAAFGAAGTWNFYAALAVDKDRNVAITYSRSGDSSYIGAVMTWRLDTDPPSTLRPSVVLHDGKANYMKTFSGTRNRWGDYNGVWTDPADQNNFWIFTEYAESPANTWATWLYNMRLVPFSGSRVYASRPSVDYGDIETNHSSDTTTLTLYNYGDAPLTISSITTAHPEYELLDVTVLPVSVATLDSLRFKVHFTPSAHGVLTDSIAVVTDDPVRPTMKIALRGKGFLIGKALAGVMYATSTTPASALYTINTATGAATLVGALGTIEIQGLAIHPTTKELYGTAASGSATSLYRISREHGDALFLRSIPIGNMRAIAFGTGDILYGATTGGVLFRVDPNTGDTVRVGASAGIAYSSLSFRPRGAEMWGSVRSTVLNKDKIYKVNTATGATTLVGSTGLGLITPHIAFGPEGRLYALIGTGTATSSLVLIDTLTAVATPIGSAGVSGLLAIAIRVDSIVTGMEETAAGALPTAFALDQNYPNPFNPATRIRYALPAQSHVTLTIVNIVGQVVTRLTDGVQGAGSHEVEWNGTNLSGRPVASGLYFYKLEARRLDGMPGLIFTDIKKMLLIR